MKKVIDVNTMLYYLKEIIFMETLRQNIERKYREYQHPDIARWLAQKQKKRGTQLGKVQTPEGLKWAIDQAEQALIALYEPHFNNTFNPTPSVLSSSYHNYCQLLCKKCNQQRINSQISIPKYLKDGSLGRGPVQAKKEQFSLAPLSRSADRECWEISFHPHSLAQGYNEQEYLEAVWTHLAHRGALIRWGHDHSCIYAATVFMKRRYGRLQKQIARHGCFLKRFAAQQEREHIHRYVLHSSVCTFGDFLWKGLAGEGLDQEAIKAHRFLYLYHNREEVFYVGQTLAPWSRMASRLGLGRETFNNDDSFTRFFRHHYEDARDQWYVSLLSLQECEELVVNSLCLAEEDTKENIDIIW